VHSISGLSGAQHRLLFESFGLTAEVLSDDRGLLDSLPDVLPPGWRLADGAPMARFGLTRDGAITVDGVEVARIQSNLEAALVGLGSIVRHHLAEHAPSHVFIHAGVVCAADRAIVIPGSSHSGKTTLVAELVRGGATYYSDEYAVVDSEGTIQPYAKPLSVRSANGVGLGALTPVPPAQIATRPIRAGLIVLTRYKTGAVWRPSVRTSGEGAFALLAHTVAVRLRPGPALAAVCRLSRDARVISGDRGEAKATGEALLARGLPLPVAPLTAVEP
jgi:hypothetical protein